eukprot:9259149-Alexandrium_andersonii.AAC.1
MSRAHCHVSWSAKARSAVAEAASSPRSTALAKRHGTPRPPRSKARACRHLLTCVRHSLSGLDCLKVAGEPP